MNILDQITEEYKKNDIPEFGIGDTVKVHIKIKEGSRERVQVFEGFVLKMQNGGVSETFTVRRIASGVGVEKTFPLHSPLIEKIEIVKKGDVRRAKLNYMRKRTGKAAKIKAKILTEEQIKAEREAFEAAKREAEEKAAAEAAKEAERIAAKQAKAEAEAKAKEEAEAKAAAEAEAPAEEPAKAEAESEEPAKAEAEPAPEAVEEPAKETPAEEPAAEAPAEATEEPAEEPAEEAAKDEE